MHWESLASCKARHDGEIKTGQKFVSHPVAAPSSGQGWLLSSNHMMGLSLLGWAQVGTSNLATPHTCQALCAWNWGSSHVPVSWRFVAFLTQLWARLCIPGTVRGILEQYVNLVMSRA